MALGATQMQSTTPMQLTRILTRHPRQNVNIRSHLLHFSTRNMPLPIVFVLNEQFHFLGFSHCGSLQGYLVEALQCMDQASPVTIIGETIWGDEAGAVHVLQVGFFSGACVFLTAIAPRIHAVLYIYLYAGSRSRSCTSASNASLTVTLPFDHTLTARRSFSLIL